MKELVYSDHIRTMDFISFQYFLTLLYKHFLNYKLKYFYKLHDTPFYSGAVLPIVGQFVVNNFRIASNTTTNIFVHKGFLYLGFILRIDPQSWEIGSRDRCTDIDMMPNCFPKGL